MCDISSSDSDTLMMLKHKLLIIVVSGWLFLDNLNPWNYVISGLLT